MGYRNIKKSKKKLISFLQIEDFDFSMSRDNAYYQFYNAPVAVGHLCNALSQQEALFCLLFWQFSVRCSFRSFGITDGPGQHDDLFGSL